jgi:hypothetical protein
VTTGGLVARPLHEKGADQGGDAAEEDHLLGQLEAIGERGVVKGHVTSMGA